MPEMGIYIVSDNNIFTGVIMKKIDLGDFECNVSDPTFKAKLEKFVTSLQNDDLSYNPFEKIATKSKGENHD